MMRRRTWVGLAAAGALLLLAFVVVSVQRRATFEAAAPPWLNPRQPAQGVAAPLTALESFAANRCRPFSASSRVHTAGLRTRRTYPATLSSSPTSFIRGHLEAGVE